MRGSGYNFLSRWTHRLALQYPAIAQASFELENLVHPTKDQSIRQPVFISGLARSGTTILLQYLHQTGEFGSLTYRDMPFVLMPHTWRKLSRGDKSSESQERAHRDGIRIGQDSPEGFEEIFWRIFCGANYIKDDKLTLHEVSTDASDKFKKFATHVAGLDGDERYLSKNNNNILRLDYLKKTFPDATIVVPFRRPLQHAISLLGQHQLFCDLQQADRFTLNYMNWLGHFEFGEGQKPFFLGDEMLFEQMMSYPKTDINFWLLTWKNYYQYLNQHLTDSVVLFDYDAFCADPVTMLSQLYKRLAIEKETVRQAPFVPKTRIVDGVNETILKDCERIYAELKQKAERQWD